MLPSDEPVVPGTEKGQGTEGLEEDLKHLREEACDRETGCGFGINTSVRFVRSLSLLSLFPLKLQACSGILHLEITTQYSPYLPCWYRLIVSEPGPWQLSQARLSQSCVLARQLNRHAAVKSRKGVLFHVATLGRGTNKEAAVTKIWQLLRTIQNCIHQHL